MVKPASKRKEKYETKRKLMPDAYATMIGRPALDVDAVAKRAEIDAVIESILNAHGIAKTDRIKYYNFGRYIAKRKDIATDDKVEAEIMSRVTWENANEEVLRDIANAIRGRTAT